MNSFSSQSFSSCLLLFAAAMLVLICCCPLGCFSRSVPFNEPIESFDQNCGANAQWTPHGTYCPPNCANRGVPGPCIKLFVPSCQCLDGFVFTGESKTGDCVRLSDCTSLNHHHQ